MGGRSPLLPRAAVLGYAGYHGQACDQEQRECDEDPRLKLAGRARLRDDRRGDRDRDDLSHLPPRRAQCRPLAIRPRRYPRERKESMTQNTQR